MPKKKTQTIEAKPMTMSDMVQKFSELADQFIAHGHNQIGGERGSKKEGQRSRTVSTQIRGLLKTWREASLAEESLREDAKSIAF